MFEGRDLSGAERLIDDWQAGFEQRAAQARELTRRLGEVTASAYSSDGLVEVTVDRSGVLIGLRLGEETRRQSAARTSQEILATITEAQMMLREQVAAVVADTVGADTDAGRAILSSFMKDRDIV